MNQNFFILREVRHYATISFDGVLLMMNHHLLKINCFTRNRCQAIILANGDLVLHPITRIYLILSQEKGMINPFLMEKNGFIWIYISFQENTIKIFVWKLSIPVYVC